MQTVAHDINYLRVNRSISAFHLKLPEITFRYGEVKYMITQVSGLDL